MRKKQAVFLEFHYPQESMFREATKEISMARVTVEDCLEKVENRFALVILAAKRVKELKRGAPLLVTDRDNREVVMALREVARSKVWARQPAPADDPAEKKELVVKKKSE